MMKVTMLGTSGATPTKHRGLPAMAITREGDVFLFDCGEGTQMRMMEHGVSISKIKAIFLTHIHGDHVIGVAGLIRTLALNARKDKLEIFIPQGFEKAVKNLIRFDKAMINYEIVVKGVKGGKAYEGKGFSVSSFKLDHSVLDYGYVFAENEKRNFITSKVNKLGIKGLMFKELEAKGSISLKGKRIRLEDVSTVQKGKKVVYANDTRPCKTTIAASKDADLLIHEATFGAKLKELAIERKHSTTIEAAEIAKKANVKQLIITHISARYRNAKELEDEAKSVFPNSSIAHDGYTINI